MADISMCKGIFDGNESDEMIRCPKRDECYRYTAPVNPYRQSFFINAPGEWKEDNFRCEYFWDNERLKLWKEQVK